MKSFGAGKSPKVLPKNFQKPGGGATNKPLKGKEEFPANVLPDGAFGEVDQAKVQKLKSNPKRPAPLKRKSVTTMPKAEKKKLIETRKLAKEKYKERSNSFRKDRVYLKNRFTKMANHTARKMSEWAAKLTAAKRPTSMHMEKKNMSNNFTLIYAVGPQHQDRRQCFREFRKQRYAAMQAKIKAGKSVDISVVKVATRPKAVCSK